MTTHPGLMADGDTSKSLQLSSNGFPLECRLVSYDPENGHMVGQIVNISVDEDVLDGEGEIDPEKLQPITFDPVHNTYRKLGEVVGQAFQDGAKLK